jgi:zinc protease
VIDETISGLGGEMNAATSQDWTYFHVVLPATRLETALDILADAAQHAAFDPVEVEREPTRGAGGDPARRGHAERGAFWRILSRGHFGEHAYGRPVLGTDTSIAGVPHQTILDYFRRSYVPNNSTVVVAGSMPAAESLDAVIRAFGGWAPSPAPARPRQLARSARRASPAPRVEGAPPDVPRHGLERGHPARPRRLRARPRDDRAGAGGVRRG